MIPADRRKRILHLALPIIGGMISQNVLNLVDTGMVGVLGDDALAGVGLGGFLNFLLTAFILGLSAGVQAMAARRVGEGRDDETAVPLNGGLILAIVAGVPLSAFLVWTAPSFFPWVADDPNVVQVGVPYLQSRLVAMTAMGMNFAFRGYWNAIDRSMLYMGTLIVMHVANIFLNWVLIFGNLGMPEYGATGAGMASAIATWIGAFSYVILGFVHARGAGFLRGLPSRDTLRTIVRVTLPAGMQQFFFAAGMTAFMAIMAEVGTRELAASKVMIDLLLVGLLPGLGFGLACASLVGQALGRGDPEDAIQWGWDVAKVSTVVVGLIALPAMIAPHWILGIFLRDPETLALAETPMRLLAVFIATDTLGLVLMNGLVGAGATRRVMIISTSLQWLLFLPAAYLLGPVLGWGMLAIWIANIVYRQVQSVAFAIEFKRGNWTSTQV